MLKNYKLKCIIIAATLFLYKTINYYNSDDAIHAKDTLTEEIEELNRVIYTLFEDEIWTEDFINTLSFFISFRT